jgi:uncharacterized protein YjiS (DUF1127 family)
MMSLYDALTAVYTHGAFLTPDNPPAYRPGPTPASPLARLAKAWRRWRAARENAAAEYALLRLDDRLLADIGVSRGDIPYLIAYGRVERPLNDNRRPEYASCG